MWINEEHELRELMKIKLTHIGSLCLAKNKLNSFKNLNHRILPECVPIIGNHSLLLILFYVQINADDDADDMVEKL